MEGSSEDRRKIGRIVTMIHAGGCFVRSHSDGVVSAKWAGTTEMHC